MEQVNLWLLLVIGLLGGFMAGLLGIGGGVIVLPLLTYLAGIPVLQATGINTIDTFAAGLSGAYAHYRRGNIHFRLGLTIFAAGVVGALVSSVLSARLTPTTVKLIYLAVACLGGGLLLLPRRENPPAVAAPDLKSKQAGITYPLWLAVVLGLVSGTLAGILGVGGGFILVPLLITVLKVPTRLTMGTTLLVVLGTSLSAFFGKLGTGQVNLLWAAPVVVGNVIGAQLGARAHWRLSPPVLRYTLALLLAIIIVRVAVDLLGINIAVR